MTKPQLRVVRPDDPAHWDWPLVYSGGKFSNLVAARRGDRPRGVEPGEQLPDHWRRKSAAELFELEKWSIEQERIGFARARRAGRLLDEIEKLEAAGKVKRGTVEQLMLEQIEQGELPRRASLLAARAANAPKK